MDEEVKLMNAMLHDNKYSALAKLAEGSYGEIFLVSSKETQKKYVLKALEIKKLIKEERLHEAYVESLILRKINHPGVIKIHETIQREEYFNQILDYCPYGDLFKLMARVNGSMKLAAMKKQIMRFYLAQVLESLCHIHSEQIIHRDFKPENIVITENRHTKIIDFGTAQINNPAYLSEIQKSNIEGLKAGLQNKKELVGSAHYLSPEALSCSYSEKSDIWAFGVMVYKFYHNSLPFVGANNFQIFKSIRESTPEIDKQIPLDIKQIIEMCLKKDPNQRPSSGMLKNFSFFSNIKFSTIFAAKSPIPEEEFHVNETTCLLDSPKKAPRAELYSIELEKRMFFGNYKPRLLCLRNKDGKLYMAYKYVDTKVTKNEVELNMNDYCQPISKDEFEVKCDDKSFVFKCSEKHDVVQVTEGINSQIREFFKLQ